MKTISFLAAAAAALVVAGIAGAGGTGPSATGGVHAKSTNLNVTARARPELSSNGQ